MSGAQCFTGTENNPDAGIFLIFGEDNVSEGYGESASCIGHLAKDDSVCTDITEKKLLIRRWLKIICF